MATLEALAAEIFNQTGKLLRNPVKAVATKLQELFRGLRPQITYDPIGDAWSARMTVSETSPTTSFLTEALEGLERFGASRKEPVALIIDEFQQVVAEGRLAAERQLRAVVQTHRHVGYVFAGSDTRMLMAMTSDHGRPFYRLGSNRYVGPVPRVDFRQNLHAVFAEAAMPITEAAVERILDHAEDVPYSVQRLANELWRTEKLAAATAVDVAQVDASLAAIQGVDAPQYGKTIQLLTPAQLKTLVAVVQEGGRQLTSAAVARRYGVPISTLRRSLAALEDKVVIRQELDAQFKAEYRCEDPFFGGWVRDFVRW